LGFEKLDNKLKDKFMALPLMPKATAVWLVDNTSLSFQQIGNFTGMHELEIQAIADGEVAAGIVGVNPITNGELTLEEIKRCEDKPKNNLKLSKSDIPKPKPRSKGARYTPVSKRQERPDAIAWMLRNNPELTDAQVCRLLGTTKQTISSIRSRTHWNMTNITPQNPVILGLCTETELQKAISTANKKSKKVKDSIKTSHTDIIDTEVSDIIRENEVENLKEDLLKPE